jgi:hypothetical protein
MKLPQMIQQVNGPLASMANKTIAENKNGN